MSRTAVTSSDQGGRASVSLIGVLTRSGTDVTAPLVIPRGHSFFFDHPLDHVSGMLTICGMLDLVDALDADPVGGAHRLLLELDFRAIANGEDRVVLTAAPDDAVREGFLLRSVQAGTIIAEGALRRVEGIAPVAPVGRRALPAQPARCVAELVNRARTDNVLLAAPERGEEGFTMPVLRPPAGHYLCGTGSDDDYFVRRMIEASRQFCTALVHEVAGKPSDNRIIWLEFTADVPGRPTGSAEFLLRWRPRSLRGSRITLDMELVDRESMTVLGHIRYQVLVVGPAAYQRFRAAARSEGER